MTILPQLERDLHRAAEARLGGARTRRPRAGVGRVLVPFGVVVALAVAGVGIAVVGGHRTAPTPPAAATPVALHRLLSRYAVLRRPQTPADRSWRLVWRGHSGPRISGPPLQIIPRFTRLAAKLADGERLFLTVGRVVGPQLGLKLGSYLMRAWVVSGDRTVIREASSFADSGATVLATSSGLRFSHFPAPQPHSTIWTAIVPDGVTAVDWTFPGRAILAFVSGNVAAARVSEPKSMVPERVSWDNSHGQVVRTFTSTAPPIPILYGNGVAGARFGERRSKVEALLTAQLGPGGRFTKGGACGVEDTVSWGELTAFFKHGKFIGYAYGSQGVPPPSAPILATARGLRLGETVFEARRLYGSAAFQVGERQGGSWYVSTPTGPLDGFLTVRGSGAPDFRIATIQAGPSICAALSP